MKGKSLTKLSVALIMALGALQANAYVHESTGMNTQVNGVQDGSRTYLIGTDFSNNGPNSQADYGDHSGSYDADTTGDVNFNITGSILDNLSNKIDAYAGGLVWGYSPDSSNSAKVTGNINLSVSQVGSANALDSHHFSIYGGGAALLETNQSGSYDNPTGNADVTGNVSISISNVYSNDFQVAGGGIAEGPTATKTSTATPSAKVSGQVKIDVKDSLLGGTEGGAEIFAAGEAVGANADASVGSVSVTLTNVNQGIGINTIEEASNFIVGGGFAIGGGTSDVEGNVSITLKNSTADFIMAAGTTQNDRDVGDAFEEGERHYGLSASVGGDVNIRLEDSTVGTIIASGNTDGSAWGDEGKFLPDDGQYGEASVGGNATITLAGNTTVGTVYLAGSGVNTDVAKDSTLEILGNSVSVDNVYGSAFNSQVKGTAKISLGGDFEGTFDTTFEGIDELEAQSGSKVTVALDNTKVGESLTLSGAGEFTAGIELTSGNLTIKGNVTASSLNLSGDSSLIINDNGVLGVTTDQVFTNALGEAGTNKDAGELNETGTHINFAAGTIAFNDAFYNSFYSNDVANLITTGTKIVFNGELVDVEGDMTLEEIADNANTIHSNIDVTASSGNIDKSFGVSSIKVGEGVSSVEIAEDRTVTLVGGDNKELIAFEGDGSNKSVTVSGTLQLGAAGSANNTGKLSAPVTVKENASFNVNAGTFEIADLTVESAKLTVNNAQATVGSLKLNGTAIATIAGSMEVTSLSGSEGSTVNVGNSDKRGDLVLGETSKLNGMAFFLDPAWKDGMEVTDASRLVFKNASVDAKIAAGQNSFVVFGSGDMTNFTPVFGKQVTWGDSGVLAAAYVAQPITIAANGGLVVDGDMTTYAAPSDGSVKFAKNSVLVADVTSVKEGQALITATSFDVDKASKAVVVGEMKNGATYQLTDGTGTLWTADNIVSGNALWGLTAKDDGSFTVKLEDANKIYGNLMQGGDLANAGMQSDGSAYDYVNSLLTDASGNISTLASTAARFDAAMNVGGALSIFTNAYDRSSELREIVRAESSLDQQPRLWAQVMGGKTKLKGISSGAQDIHTETDHYGLVIGAEGTIDNKFSLGVALAAGSGDTDNDKVNAKDEFDYYGISVYGRTSVGVVDILGDVSATFLKSDMKMHGVADIDTDTDTAVYSAGVQAQKTFDLGWADVTPFVGMDIYHVKSDGYSAGHGIKVEDADATAVEFPIGAKIAKSFETAGGMTVAPTFSLAVVPTVADRDIDSKVKFAGASSKYNFTFADDVQVRSELGVQAAKDNFRFGLNAGYDWGNEERSDLSVQARLKYLF